MELVGKERRRQVAIPRILKENHDIFTRILGAFGEFNRRPKRSAPKTRKRRLPPYGTAFITFRGGSLCRLFVTGRTKHVTTLSLTQTEKETLIFRRFFADRDAL